MILKKPYAFFIKMFKPIHVLIAFSIIYLSYLTSKILNFLNTYMSAGQSLAQNIKTMYFPNTIFLIPIIIIVLCLMIIGIMFRKKKPFLFYLISVFLYLIIIVISLYTNNFFGIIEKATVSIKVLKLMRDLILINLIIEIVTFIFFLVRGIGLDFKKFEFESDLFKIDISESDREEIELSINVDLNETRRKRRERIRFLKYKYLENKFMYNSIAILIIIFVFVTSFVIIKNFGSKNTEGKIYTVGLIDLSVENSKIIDKDYRGNIITNNSLIVVNCKINSRFGAKNISLNDFTLIVDEISYNPTTKYNDSLTDLGSIYNGEKLSEEYSNYIFIYEIPKDSVNKKMKFKYASNTDSIDIAIKPVMINEDINQITNEISEELMFKDTLGNLSFKINNYEIKNYFLVNYNYCVKDNDCVVSREYLKPSIDQNFDKTILRLNIDFNNDTEYSINSFYDLLETYGNIYYNIDNKWYVQEGNFENIKSTRTSLKNDIYLGVNSEILKSNSIKLVFNIRNYRYEYVIK